MPAPPSSAWLSVAVGVAAILLATVGRRALMANNERRYPRNRLGALARRLGMRIVEGDPELNMIHAEMVRGGGATRVLLQGAPFGRRTEFLFDSLECRLSVEAPTDVPAFELVRRARSGLSAPALGLPRQSIGDSGLDARITFTSNDPTLGPLLAPAITGLRAHGFVHIRCMHGRLSSLASPLASPLAIRHIDDTARVLHDMAEVLWRGRATPRYWTQGVT